MIFTELRFLVFFAIVLGVHWALPRNRPRKVWLLAASYVFYAAWDWRFLSLILGSTIVDYIVGIKLDGDRAPRVRRAWVSVSVIVNLSLLAVFKYFHFFADSAAALLQTLGLAIEPSSLRIILPVGISFYTFQTMSYSLDIYRGKLRATRDFLDLALFVGFFPQLVAGPIVRARDFLPQLTRRRAASDVAFRPLLLLFLSGFFKKACISDNISGVVDTYFTDPSAYDAMSAWIAVLLYAVQIYCDFSGYSDMAIATAGFLGYSLCENFAFPYFAGSIQDFWRRWHISLSSWLRDYLYILLGGGYGGRLFRYRNLMLTMLLGGLWHGAAWRFVIWGGLHGLALIVHREFHDRLRGRSFRVPAPVGVLLTFWWVGLTWIFFRATDWQSAFV
ncbi:MAG: MBOAT family protein, partial [Gemmatimonadetes bacterium]|nr:MBOAT family protein [Gemmatimonadota bacterium]